MPIQNQTEIRSEGLRDFISNRPGWFIRWGIPVFFFFLAGIGIATWFIQYPDIVKANARVQAVYEPKQVIAKYSGRIIKLLKQDGNKILEKEIIGYLESTAKHEEVIQLDLLLDTLQLLANQNRLEELPDAWNKTYKAYSNLGELQTMHQKFMQDFENFKNYLSNGFYVSKKKLLLKDKQNTEALLKNLYEQKQLQMEDLELSSKTYKANDTLHKQKVISDLDLRTQKSALIGKELSIPQINTSIINNQNQQNALNKEILELDNQIMVQKALFVQSLNAYKGNVLEWKQKYLFIASIEGTLSYVGFLQENQQVRAEQVIAYITPSNSDYFVEMNIPQTNFGKVKTGQDVLLKFQSYPFEEFGSIKGKIAFIKPIPTDSGYVAKVSLYNGQVTSTKKTLFLQSGMRASAEIVTADRRLSDRFLSGIRGLLQQ